MIWVDPMTDEEFIFVKFHKDECEICGGECLIVKEVQGDDYYSYCSTCLNKMNMEEEEITWN